MPAKTKAEKIATETRREKIEYSLPTLAKQSVFQPKIVTQPNDYSYVTFDLKKIGLFSLLAFGAEIALKVILQKG